MNIGTLWVTLAADTSQLDNLPTKLNTMSQRLRTIGYLTSAVLTVPIVAAGRAAFQLAKDYEYSIQKIVGLTGVAQKSVNAWSEEILKMGPEVAKGPKELADALYFISSSGIKGKEAMSVLNLSAKAASAGLGETKTVADFLTSALNAYAGTGLTASYATDVLVAAVREGKAEATGFASAIGQVIPIAAELGVPLDQLAGAMTAITLTGASASNAAVYFKGVLNSLLKETVSGEKALNSMGSSYAELRKILRQEGTIPLMQKIRDMSVQYGETLASDIFPNIRGLLAYLAIAGKNFQYNTELMKRVTASTGSLGKAFAAVADTIKIRYDQAISQAQVSMISLGKSVAQSFLPLLEKLVKKLTELTNWFNNLSEEQKKHKLTILAVSAAFGPLFLVFSVIGYSLSAMVTGFKLLRTTLIGLGVVVKGLGGDFGTLRRMMQVSPILTKGLFTVSKFAGPWIAGLTAIGGVILGLNRYQKKVEELAKSHDSFNTSLVKVNGTLQKLKDLTPADYGVMTLNELNAAQIAAQREWVTAQALLNQGMKNKTGYSFFERMFGANKNNDKFIQDQQKKIAVLKAQYEALGDSYYDVWKKSLIENEIKKQQKALEQSELLTAKLKEQKEALDNLNVSWAEAGNVMLLATALGGKYLSLLGKEQDALTRSWGTMEKLGGKFVMPKYGLKQAAALQFKPIMPGEEDTRRVDQVQKFTKGLINQQEAVRTLANAFEALFDKTGGGFKAMIEQVQQGIRRLVAEILAKAAIWALLNALTGGTAGTFRNFMLGGKIASLPTGAKGGTVPSGYPNDTYPALLTSGEEVVPPYKMSQKNTNAASFSIIPIFDKLIKSIERLSGINTTLADPIVKSMQDLQKYKDIAVFKHGATIPKESYIPIQSTSSFAVKDIENGMPGIRNGAQVNKEVLAAISKAAAIKNIPLMTALETGMRESGLGSHLNDVNRSGQYNPAAIMGNASEVGMPVSFDQFLLKNNLVEIQDVIKGIHGITVGGSLNKYIDQIDKYDKYLSEWKNPYANALPFEKEMDVLKIRSGAAYNPKELDRANKLGKERSVFQSNPEMLNFADSVYKANLNTAKNSEDMMQIGTSLTNDYNKSLLDVINSTKMATDVTNTAANSSDKASSIFSKLLPSLFKGALSGGGGQNSGMGSAILGGILNILLPGSGSLLTAALPKFANGGIVPAGYPNDTYPALLTSGERVLPTGTNNLKSPSMNWEDVKFVIEQNQLVGILKKATKQNSLY